jgi:DNA-binding CsgD family transcriptional regulator
MLDKLYVEGTSLERMQQRNEEIQRLNAEGLSKTEIGRRFGISPRRVGQIIDEVE